MEAPGDSGSWVIRDGKLCGYIYGGIENKPWAYMIPIESVFNHITQLLGSPTRIKVPSQDQINEAISKSAEQNKVQTDSQHQSSSSVSVLGGQAPHIITPIKITTVLSPEDHAPQ